MDIKQLKYFLTVAEESSFSRAAEKLYMAQPPLSHQIKLLEDELGVTLLERTTRKLQLTDAGKALVQRSKQLMEFLETSVKEVKDIHDGLQGTLSIGTVSSAGAALLPERIRSFHENYPGINFEILDEDTAKIIELLDHGVIDIGIIRTPFNLDSFEAILLSDEPMIAVSNTEIANCRESVKMTDLADTPLIVQRRNEAVIQELFEKSGFKPRIICRSNDVRTILLWAGTGLGTAVVPKNCLNLVPDTNLQYKEIAEPLLITGTAVIWPKQRYISSAARRFLETFKASAY
ncbi:MAG: LysR family transcriptional regulator [Bacillota bacterium]|nr:LysR family transcriptional regulator [Bacillota bacterium]